MSDWCATHGAVEMTTGGCPKCAFDAVVRAARAASRPGEGTPADDLLTMAVNMIERLRAHCAARYPDVHRVDGADYELGTLVVGLIHWSDMAKEALRA